MSLPVLMTSLRLEPGGRVIRELNRSYYREVQPAENRGSRTGSGWRPAGTAIRVTVNLMRVRVLAAEVLPWDSGWPPFGRRDHSLLAR